MRIRKATQADAWAIAEVHVRSWRAAYRGLVPQAHLDGLDAAARRPAWERWLAGTAWPREGTLVAEAGGRVVGFASVLPSRDDDEDGASVAEVATIYLTPESWGRGIGRALMDAALAALTGAGYQEAVLWVLDSNVRARRFYEAAGWHDDGVAKDDGSRGFTITEVRYRRSLA
ncbi:GNAT family N-acetyltransferase [Nonomuraea sp. NPDC052265]|uniref:GNAT family N-acetyltransferase n=1 Tax=Nonomuraea sp. NPDC052265 TaxID=3364374 RepID=UPI0037C769F8